MAAMGKHTALVDLESDREAVTAQVGLRRWQKAALAAGSLVLSAGLLTGASKFGFNPAFIISKDAADKVCRGVSCPVGMRLVQSFDGPATWNDDVLECCTAVSPKTISLGFAATAEAEAGLGIYLKPDGTTVTLGNNDDGALAPHPPGVKAVEVSAGGGFTLSVTTDGKVFSVGNNSYGQLGRGLFSKKETSPKEVIGLPSKVVSVASGWTHSLFLLDDGRVFGAGDASQGFGQLGLVYVNQSTPVLVFDKCSSIFASTFGSYCLKGDGTVEMVGSMVDYPPEFPRGTPVVEYRVPTKLDVCDVSTIGATVADDDVLFVHVDGSVSAMGPNPGGPLGLGDDKPRTRPVALPDCVQNIVAATVGYDGTAEDNYPSYSLLVDKDGAVYGAGANFAKQLGSLAAKGTFKHTLIPELKGKNIVSVSAGYQSAAFLAKDGSLLVAGGNAAGELPVSGQHVLPTLAGPLP